MNNGIKNNVNNLKDGIQNFKLNKKTTTLNKQNNIYGEIVELKESINDFKSDVSEFIDDSNRKNNDFNSLINEHKETELYEQTNADIDRIRTSIIEDSVAKDSATELQNSSKVNYNNKLSYKVGTNIIQVNEPVAKGQQYELTQEEINYLAYVASREQGTVEGAKLELSLMANLYESFRGTKYSSIVSYVDKSGWFGKNNRSKYYYPGDEYVAAVEDVLVDGNRYLPTNVDEHDCISDITSVKVNGQSIDPNNRDAYVPYETQITNKYGATYTFVGFAPTSKWGVKGDPFGYINE